MLCQQVLLLSAWTHVPSEFYELDQRLVYLTNALNRSAAPWAVFFFVARRSRLTFGYDLGKEFQFPLSRTAGMSNWWHATVHWVAIIVGVGFLSYPADLVYLGWWPGMLLIAICWILTLHTLWKMIELHDIDEGGARGDTYAGLGRLAWGAPGAAVMRFTQFFASIAVNIAYLITGGYSVYHLFPGLGRSVISIVLFAAAQVVGAKVSGLSGLVPYSAVSLLATIVTVFTIIGLMIHIRDGQPHPHFSIPSMHRIPKTFNSMGNIGFAFSGHYLAMEVQSSLSCARSTKAPMWHGILASYVLIGLTYFPIAALGYSTFGNLTCYDNVLPLLRHPDWAFKLGNAMLVFHLSISYQIRANPIYESLESFCSKKPFLSWIPSLAVRSSLVAFTCLVAVLLPFFNELVGIIGGLVLIPSSYIMPCLVWLAIRKPEPLTPSWLVTVTWIVFGTALSVLALVGSLWNLVAYGLPSRERFFYLPKREC